MPQITRDQVRVPADVMPESRDEYIANYLKATRGTGRLMLFACDQKIEHLNTRNEKRHVHAPACAKINSTNFQFKKIQK